MTRKIKYFLTSLFIIGWLFLFGPSIANADEVTVQVTPASPTPSSDTSTATTPITVESVAQKVESASNTLQQAAETQSTAITQTIQANIPNTTTEQAATIATTQEPIATAVAEATVKVQEATTAIQSAQTAVSVATTAQAAVDSQTVVVAQATTNLNNAQSALNTVTQQVESQTAVVAVDTANVTSATNAVNAQQTVVNTATTNLTNAQNTLTNLQNTPSDSKAYTTAGYVAPVAPETPTVTTVTLPAMYDGATKITTPFDIKMGNTVYEGQGAASQIYVTSKATITFGTGDFNWWDFPNGPSISVFGSDFQSAGPNAGITVTTTETTLAVDWDLHRFSDNNGPVTNVNWTMTVNPTTGEWTGVGTVAGNTTNLWNGPRIGVRETAGAAVKPMTNVTNTELTAQIESQTAVVADKTQIKTEAVTTLNTLTSVKETAVATLNTDTTLLNTLKTEKTNAEAVVADKTQIKTTEIATLTQLTETATATVQAANTLANTATTKVNEAVTAMTNAAQVTVNYYAEQQAAAQAAASAAAAAAAEKAAQESAAADARAAQAEAQAKAAAEAAAKAEAEAKAAAETAAKAEAEAKAAAEAAAKAEADRIAAEEAAAKAEAEKLAAEAEAAAKAAEEKAAAEAAAKAEAEAKAQAEANAKAEADKAAAEAAAKAAEQKAAEQAAKDAQAKADAAKAEADKIAADKLAAEEKAKQETIGVKPNNPDQLSDTVVKEAPKEALVPRVQVDKAGVENGGIEFFGTKSAPQVVGEDGKLTPPAPPPGSGLPIPPDAITTTETFIGQPGGTTFNAPDIAVPVIIKPVCVTIVNEAGKEIHVDVDGNEHPIEACTFLPAALEGIPGAAVAMEALNALYGDMANLGNDMSPVTRKKAKKVLLATIVLGQIAAFRRRFGE